MPFFRRGNRQSSGEEFFVGVDGHRVRLGGAGDGCSFVDGIDDWVESVGRRNAARPRSDGRDSIALLNAKMDYAEMVDAAVSLVTLTLEELVERGILGKASVPPRPPLTRITEQRTYDYIQDAYTRARTRREWLREADTVLRERGVTIVAPPVDDA